MPAPLVRPPRPTYTVWPPYCAAFRDDLAKNRDLLETHQVQMGEDEDEMVRLMAKLTCVRLQDIIAWMISVDQ
jgi:hypothetical protein